VGMSTYSRIGVSGAALHMAHRGLMALILLAAAHELEREAMDSSQPAAPYSWGTLLVGVLALIGVPPLAGFAANWAVLQAASLVDWRLTAALAITSAVALAAGLAAVGRLRGSYPLPWRRPSPVERYLMALTALAALWGLAPGPALRAIHEAVSELAFVRPF
jgi:formate hydrogenlyase subunit 3/multisubunit Na+/H+ antiporter MnhD subunit